jgi:hypothetical protein
MKIKLFLVDSRSNLDLVISEWQKTCSPYIVGHELVEVDDGTKYFVVSYTDKPFMKEEV